MPVLNPSQLELNCPKTIFPIVLFTAVTLKFPETDNFSTGVAVPIPTKSALWSITKVFESIFKSASNVQLKPHNRLSQLRY